MRNHAQQGALVFFARLAAVTAAYYLGGRLGLSIPYLGSHVGLIWPPTGIALAAMLRWGFGMWPAVWLGAFLVNMAVDSTAGLAAGIAVGNTAGPLLAAFLFRRAGLHLSMDRRRDLLAYLGVAASCMAVNATNGALNLVHADVLAWENFSSAWLLWWLGDTVGALLVGIPLLSLSRVSLAKAFRGWRGGETLLLLLGVAATGGWLFVTRNAGSAVLFLPFLMLAWLALRSGVFSASMASLLLSLIAAWGTSQGFGPFYSGDPHQGLAMLWGYTATLSIIAVLITSLISEQAASEERLRLALEATEDGVWDWNIASGELYWSPRYYTMLGYGPEELPPTYEQWASLLHPEDRGRTAESLGKQMSDGTQLQLEFRLAAKNGEWRWILSRGRVVEWDEEGKPRRMIGTHTDITERRKMEESLRESNRMLDEVQHIAHLGAWSFDPATKEIRWTDEVFRLAGIERQPKAPGVVEFMEHVHPDDRGKLRDALARWQEEGQPCELELRYGRPDGSYSFVLTRAKPVFHEGAVVKVVGSVLDITERKRMEEALRENEEKYRVLFELSPLGISLTDPEGNIVEANRASEQLLELGRETRAARKIGEDSWRVLRPDLSPMPPEEFPSVLALRERRRIDNVEMGVTLPQGDVAWLSVSAAPVPLEKYGVAIAFIDITARRHAEMALLDLNRTLEQRVREEVTKNLDQERLLIQQSRLAAMGEMIGNIAHQWRQPINALNLLLANIRDAYEFGELNRGEIERQVETGNRLIQKMSATIDDFRDFFRPNKEKAPFQLAKVVEEVKNILGASLAHHGVRLEVEILDDVTAMGYANECAQALLNLVNNAKESLVAREATDGVIRVTVGRDGGMAVARVRDNGGGVPEDVLPKIFDPYFTTKPKGTGIGLYMSKIIVENNMGGRLAARNVPGGAEFTLAVPAA